MVSEESGHGIHHVGWGHTEPMDHRASLYFHCSPAIYKMKEAKDQFVYSAGAQIRVIVPIPGLTIEPPGGHLLLLESALHHTILTSKYDAYGPLISVWK